MNSPRSMTSMPLTASWTTRTIAVLIESIQGEGGIHEARDDFLQGLEKLCRERNALLMIDEVQSGIGRDRGLSSVIGNPAFLRMQWPWPRDWGEGFPLGHFGSANNGVAFSNPEATGPPLAVLPWPAPQLMRCSTSSRTTDSSRQRGKRAWFLHDRN